MNVVNTINASAKLNMVKIEEPQSFETLLSTKDFESNLAKKSSALENNLKTVLTNSKADFTPQLEKDIFTKSGSMIRKLSCRHTSQSPKKCLLNNNLDFKEFLDGEDSKSVKEKSSFFSNKKSNHDNSTFAASFSSMKSFHFKSDALRSQSNLRNTCTSKPNLIENIYSKSNVMSLSQNLTQKS